MPTETVPTETVPTETEPRVSPSILDQIDESLDTPWVVILYNCDCHTFDAVIMQLQKATGCSQEQAVWIAMEAHTSGRAIAFSGSLEDCERVAAVLRSIKLQVETDKA